MVDRHAIERTRGGLVALSGIGACVADHDSFEVNFDLGVGQFVFIKYFSSEVRNVDSSIAFSADKELIFF